MLDLTSPKWLKLLTYFQSLASALLSLGGYGLVLEYARRVSRESNKSNGVGDDEEHGGSGTPGSLNRKKWA